MDDAVIAHVLEHARLFASVFAMECTTQFRRNTYNLRDSVEKCFMAGKMNLNMDVLRAHSTHTMEGRFIVSFAALSILRELKLAWRRPRAWS